MPNSLFDTYRPLQGVSDELVDASGNMRPVWSGLINHLSGLDPAQVAGMFARGDQHLADAGVFFRRYGDATIAARDWPFSPVPIILAESDWRHIETGLKQRADLLEQVCADLYGPNRLVADGHLPGALIAQCPEWLRPMVGIAPKSGHYLHFVAFEIGRGPKGDWWVLSDRTDAPSGAGFALENRMATSLVFPDLYQRSHVHRLAGFFQAFRDGLNRLRSDPQTQVGILTPGPLNDTYYEQAYIARYLGLILLEGEDLTVEDGQLRIRTVQGLAPVDVLWRRIDALWTDPLEYLEQSQLGTPGLMSAIRAGNVTMVNALGAGVLETQVMMAFLPRISRHLHGRPLMIPNVATYWCGQTAELDHVRANAGRMMIGPALATRMPFETDATYALAGDMQNSDGTALHDWLSSDAAELVGHELVKLSTTPVYENGTLVPRPMSIRVFLARTEDGWQVMPGGFGRIGATQDTAAIAMRDGGTVADVWVVSDAEVPATTNIPRTESEYISQMPGPLPSRAADNLFWLGRYVERTEGLLRLVRAYHARLAEAAKETSPLLDALQAELKEYGVVATEAVPKGVLATMASAVGSAGNIRDRFSVDGWAALEDLNKSMRRMAQTAAPGHDAALVMSVLLRKLNGFSGLVHENMYRATGWQFLTLGRSLERATMMTRVLARMADPQGPQGGLDLAIEFGDSVMIHRQRNAVSASRASVIDLLALDARNPRAVMFHISEVREQVEKLSATRQKSHLTDFEKRVLAVQTSLALHSVSTLDTAALVSTQADISGLSNALLETFLH